MELATPKAGWSSVTDRETLADVLDVETIWTGKTGSPTAHLDPDCFRLVGEAHDRPADAIPTNHYDCCPNCTDE